MPEVDQSGVAAGVSPAPAAAPITDLQIIGGGIDIDAVKIDGTLEKVKVRQLPIALLGEWGNSQGQENEAYLIELLCDRVDRATSYHLTNARLAEMRVQSILFQAPIEQIEAIQKRLSAIREEIAQHEAKPRWSDTLTHETVERIREIGELLNKKKFSSQTLRATASSKAILETMGASASSTSSAPSPPSGAPPNAT